MNKGKYIQEVMGDMLSDFDFSFSQPEWEFHREIVNREGDKVHQWVTFYRRSWEPVLDLNVETNVYLRPSVHITNRVQELPKLEYRTDAQFKAAVNTLRDYMDTMLEALDEDNASGKISDERFTKMSAKYEAEQAEIAQRAKALAAELERETDQSMTTDMFIATVRKYTRAKKLTQRMLSELIDHIDVHQAEKIDGVHVQKLTIHYNCVGSIEIPDIVPLPQPEVLIQTRKGVAVSYSSSQNVVNL